MNKLINVSEATYLALHGLALIAERAPERINVKYLTNALDASEAHLAKVFQKLRKADLVSSVRGPSGGFILNKNPEDISFLDIFEVIEGKIKLGGCPFGKTKCAFSKCIFNAELNHYSQQIYDSYSRMTLANFLT